MSKFCSKCGNELENGASFCEKCGNSVTEESVENTSNVVQGEGKSKIAAGILGILLGSLGIHNFYLGYTGKGIAQLLISILSCGMLAVVSAIWGLVEGIIILTSNNYKDAKGNRLV